MRKLTLVVCLLIACSALAMDPNPRLKELEIFAHNYTCTGTAFANPMSPEHATQANVTGTWTLDGNWISFSYIETKTAKNPMPFAVRGFMGYDPAMNKLIVGAVENMGGRQTSAGDGWNGDSITFEGPWHMGKDTVNGRDTFTKTAKGMNHAAWIEMDGKWVKTDEETCTRMMKK
jgi:hypothetical protein